MRQTQAVTYTTHSYSQAEYERGQSKFKVGLRVVKCDRDRIRKWFTKHNGSDDRWLTGKEVAEKR
jgi:hypothetical protein